MGKRKVFRIKQIIKRYRDEYKKGFIMMYTLIIGMIMLVLAACIFSLQAYEMKYTISLKKHLLSEDKYERYKAYNLTKLNDFIYNNIGAVTEENIKGYFYNTPNKTIVVFEDTEVLYNSDSQCFEIIMPYEEHYFRKDIYKFEVEDGKVEYIYYNTEYF